MVNHPTFLNVGMDWDREKIYRPFYFPCSWTILKESFLLNENNFGLNIFDESIQGYWKLVVLLYADDTVLFLESEEELQQLLIEFQSYHVRRKLNVNPEKSKIVVVSHISRQHAFSFNEQPIGRW